MKWFIKEMKHSHNINFFNTEQRIDKQPET